MIKTNLKWFLRYCSQAKLGIFFVVLLVIIAAFSNSMMVRLQGVIIDELLLSADFNLLLRYVFIIFGVTILYFASNGSSNILAFNSARHISETMVSDQYKKYQRISMNELQKQKSVQFVNLFTHDINQIINLLSYIFPKILLNSLYLCIYLWFLLSTSVSMSLIMIGIALVYIYLNKRLIKNLHSTAASVQDTRADLLVGIEERITSTREAIAYNNWDFEKNRIQSLFSDFFTKLTKETRMINKRNIYGESLKWGTQIIFLIYGGYLTITNQITIGDFVVVYQFASRFLAVTNDCYTLSTDLVEGMVHVERLRTIDKYQKEQSGNIMLLNPIKKIQFKNVFFRYNPQGAFVLNDLNLDIDAGKKIALVGRSGSGKSSIAKILTRLENVESGQILIDQIPINSIDNNSLRNNIAIASQDPHIFPESIKTNILMGASKTEEKVQKTIQRVCISDLIDNQSQGLEKLVGDRGITLSGGQKHRLAIARALIRDSEILILDESTSALDFETERKIQMNIDNYRKGKTTIIIAHRLSTVMNSDMICFMKNGRIVASGTHDELMSDFNEYKELVEKEIID